MSESKQNLTKLSMLTPTQRAFVIARAHGKTIIEAAEVAGINRNTPRLWDADLINEAIAEIQQSWIANPNDAMQALLPLALQQLGELLKGRSFEAIQEVFNRAWGKAVQRQELSGPGGDVITVKVEYASDHD